MFLVIGMKVNLKIKKFIGIEKDFGNDILKNETLKTN
jgi:hypothetical protein